MHDQIYHYIAQERVADLERAAARPRVARDPDDERRVLGARGPIARLAARYRRVTARVAPADICDV